MGWHATAERKVDRSPEGSSDEPGRHRGSKSSQRGKKKRRRKSSSSSSSNFTEDGIEVRSNIVFVCDLPPYGTTKETLVGFFRKFGRIMNCVMVEKGRAPGFAFVHFDNQASADRVIGDGGMQQLKGKWIEVRKAVPMSQALEDRVSRLKEWRALLREWHPDKNPDRVEIAT